MTDTSDMRMALRSVYHTRNHSKKGSICHVSGNKDNPLRDDQINNVINKTDNEISKLENVVSSANELIGNLKKNKDDL